MGRLARRASADLAQHWTSGGTQRRAASANAGSTYVRGVRGRRAIWRTPQRSTVDAVRVATWNVNSVKQRLPRLLPWLDERQPGRGLPAGDEARRRGLPRSCSGTSWRAAATRSPCTARRAGTASRSSRASASRTSSPGLAGAPGLPASGGAGGGGHLRRRPGALGLRAERARAGLRALRVQARLAGGAARRGGRGARGDGRLRRRQHRPDRRGRLRPRGLRRPDARDAARARGAGGAAGARPARRRPRPLAGASGSSPTGTTGPGCSTATSGCGST